LASRLEAEMQHSEAPGARRAEQASELSHLRRELKEAEEMQSALQERLLAGRLEAKMHHSEALGAQ